MKISLRLYYQISIALLLSITSISMKAQDMPEEIYFDISNPQVRFAVNDIIQAISTKGHVIINNNLEDFKPINAKTSIIISAGKEQNTKLSNILKIEIPLPDIEQSYSLRKKQINGKNIIAIFGFDANGAMYGALDIAESIQIGTFGSWKDCDKRPYIANRGIKLNIPLDLRTPSYSDCGDAAQANIPQMWEMEFWKNMLDNMARNRYNLLSLWSLHPFPSMVKVPEFPDVALKDVWRTTWPLTDDFNGTGSDAVKPEMLAHHEVVKKMTIEEKIKFWQNVMQYGKDRGIRFYVFTWNIFTYGAEPKYGITCDRSNDTTIQYFRASVRELIKTYPLLAGIGITSGEHMMKSDKYSSEQWLWRTYGEGINDGLTFFPGRDFRLIHRFHWSAQNEILKEFKGLKCPLDFSFKYSIAHMYSMTNPPFIKELLSNLAEGMKTWLTVRNDDIYSFRWGDPDYARDYIKAIPPASKIAGYYMGPDGYTWGREFLSIEPDTPRQTVIEKQWYSFMLWGKLSYDPNISDEHFKQILATRFPEVPAEEMFTASQAASRIFPEITRFFWGDIDERWFPEACCHRKSTFYTVKDFITQPVMPESGNLSILEWRDNLLTNRRMAGKTPLQVAESLHLDAEKTLKLINELKPLQGNNKELRLTLCDYECFANLGNYYAEKILGAANLALYDATSEPSYQQASIRHLEIALEHWKKYAASYTKQYIQPVMYNRVKQVDIPGRFLQEAANDILVARCWKTGSIQKKEMIKADKPFKL